VHTDKLSRPLAVGCCCRSLAHKELLESNKGRRHDIFRLFQCRCCCDFDRRTDTVLHLAAVRGSVREEANAVAFDYHSLSGDSSSQWDIDRLQEAIVGLGLGSVGSQTPVSLADVLLESFNLRKINVLLVREFRLGLAVLEDGAKGCERIDHTAHGRETSLQSSPSGVIHLSYQKNNSVNLGVYNPDINKRNWHGTYLKFFLWTLYLK